MRCDGRTSRHRRCRPRWSDSRLPARTPRGGSRADAVRDLIRVEDRVVGVRADAPDGPCDFPADLVADCRRSTSTSQNFLVPFPTFGPTTPPYAWNWGQVVSQVDAHGPLRPALGRHDHRIAPRTTSPRLGGPDSRTHNCTSAYPNRCAQFCAHRALPSATGVRGIAFKPSWMKNL